MGQQASSWGQRKRKRCENPPYGLWWQKALALEGFLQESLFLLLSFHQLVSVLPPRPLKTPVLLEVTGPSCLRLRLPFV